jgi:hypothetical protein
MKNRLQIVNLVALLFVNGAYAESKDSNQKNKVVYEKNTKLNFDEAVVDGQFQNPDAQLVDSDKNVVFDSMIEEKKDFKKELKRSSGAIR